MLQWPAADHRGMLGRREPPPDRLLGASTEHQYPATELSIGEQGNLLVGHALNPQLYPGQSSASH